MFLLIASIVNIFGLFLLFDHLINKYEKSILIISISSSCNLKGRVSIARIIDEIKGGGEG